MATEATFASSFAGRLPSIGGSKVPGPGLKIKYGLVTLGTSDYAAGGIAAADLETLFGLTHIEAIVPCGVFTNNSGVDGYPASWDGVARKLQIFGNSDADLAGAATVGTEPGINEMADDDASIDAAVCAVLVIGY